ncbi:hypothetical protein IG631_10725 [Alternaria alternata]|nr:hypothetical protein IG631_10725 [Alternaria alternata]
MFAQGTAKIFIRPITKRTKTKVGQTANAWSDLLRCPWGRLDYASNDRCRTASASMNNLI